MSGQSDLGEVERARAEAKPPPPARRHSRVLFTVTHPWQQGYEPKPGRTSAFAKQASHGCAAHPLIILAGRAARLPGAVARPGSNPWIIDGPSRGSKGKTGRGIRPASP